MAINSYFFNAVESGGVYDRTYNADDFTSYLDEIVGDGVFPNPSDNLQVRASSGMNVIVGAGQGWINGHKMINTADLTLPVTAANVSNPRIDRVVFYVDFANRLMNIEIKEGTPASSPTAPALVRNTTRYEMSLATIEVAKQTTSISNSNITDTRGNSSVCGYVQGLIQQVDTDTLFTQWQTAFNEQMANMQAWQEQMKTQFDAWMATLTSELTIGAYIKEYEKVIEMDDSSSGIVSLDWTGYTYEETDILIITINGLVASENYDYLLDTRGTPVQVHLNLVNTQDELVDIRVLKSVLGVSS